MTFRTAREVVNEVLAEEATGSAKHIATVNAALAVLGLGPLDEDDAVVIDYKGEAVVVLLDDDVLVVTSPAFDLPAKGRAAIFEELLALSGGDLGEAAFVLAPDRTRVMLRVARCAEGLDEVQLARALEVVGETMLQRMDEIRRELGIRAPE